MAIKKLDTKIKPSEEEIVNDLEINEKEVDLDRNSPGGYESKEDKDKQSTADTSNDNIKNFDLVIYDHKEFLNSELSDEIEKYIFSLKNLIFLDEKTELIHTDGERFIRIGALRIELLKLFENLSKVDFCSIINSIIEHDFMEKLLGLFLEFPRANILHNSITRVLKNFISYLTDNIDRAFCESILGNFMEYIYEEIYAKFKNLSKKTVKAKFLFKGNFDDLVMFLNQKIETIYFFFDNQTWEKFKIEYLIEIIKFNENKFLYQKPIMHSEISESNFDFILNNDKMNKLIESNKAKNRKFSEDSEEEKDPAQ